MLKENRRLKEQLQHAGRNLQRYEGRLLWLRGIPTLLALLTLFLVLDLILQLSAGWRWTALIASILGVSSFTTYALWVGYIKKPNLRHTARHLEQQAPELGSSLINFLDLEDTIQDSSKPELTRQMAEHAQIEHATLANRTVLHKLTRNPKLRSGFEVFGLSLLCFIALCVVFWPFFKAHLPRFLVPFADFPPYSMTTLAFGEPTEESDPIVFGNPLRIRVDAKGHLPKHVDLIYWPTDRPDERYQTAMLLRGDSSFVQQIERIEEPITLIAQTANGRSQTKPLNVDVYLNPQIESVEIAITPPAYTGLPPSLRKYTYNEIRALEGSQIALRATSNRPLQSGKVRMERPLDTEPFKTVTMGPLKPMAVEGLFDADESTGFTIQVIDKDGLSSELSPRGSIEIVKDRTPTVAITQPESSTLLALDASIDIAAEASDDYGLKELRIHRAINGLFTAPTIIKPETGERKTYFEWTLDFATIGVQPEDIVSIYAEAIDNAPDPQITRTEMITIAAISVEDYNSLLRQEADLSRVAKKYEALREDFDDLMNRLEEQADAAQKLREQLEQTEDPEERAKLIAELEKLQKEQAQLNEAINELADALESAVRDSPLYDVESNFQKRLQSIAENLRSAASQNQQQNNALQERFNQNDLSPEEQAAMMEQFEQALQAQKEQLLGPDESVQAIEESMQDMARFHEMVKNFNRFTALANQQRALADQAAAYDQTGRLSREDQLALRDLAHDQKLIADELKFLTQKFRDDAEAGEELFPKAAASSFEFADAIESARAESLARRTSDSMLDGQGERSHDLASATAEAMEALISQCNGSMGEMREELDQALSAKRPGGQGAGNTFEQMLENMRMRYNPGSSLSGFGNSSATGSSASSGYSTSSGDQPSLMGNESLASEGSSNQEQSDAGGSGSGPGGGSETTDSTGAEGSLSELEEQRRKSESVRGESLFIEHSDIVDAYFKKITE